MTRFSLFLGNNNIFAITNQKLYSARFDLKDDEQEKKYAVYEEFWIDDENHKYTLHVSSYTGDAGIVKNMQYASFFVSMF